MWSSLGAVGTVGTLVTFCVVAGRVLGLMIALRGTSPAERPEIIRALNDSGARAIQRRAVRATGRRS